METRMKRMERMFRKYIVPLTVRSRRIFLFVDLGIVRPCPGGGVGWDGSGVREFSGVTAPRYPPSQSGNDGVLGQRRPIR